MKIDPTKWPKVEGSTFPADGKYWHVYSDGDVAIYVHEKTERVDRGASNDFISHYGPIEFEMPKPKVIPPKPELVCVEYTGPNDPYAGKIGWGCIEGNGDAWPVIDGVVYCFNKNQYKIIET